MPQSVPLLIKYNGATSLQQPSCFRLTRWRNDSPRTPSRNDSLMPKLINPVIMVGPTRSGKSRVANILASTGHYMAMFEPITVWNIGRRWRRQDDVRGADEATPQVIAAIQNEFAKRLSTYSADRFVDDLPHHTFRIDFCRAVVPEARFILVTRDARGAIPCMRHGWEYRDSLGKLAKRRLSANRYRSINPIKLAGPALRWGLNTLRTRLGRQKVSWGPTAPGQTEFAKNHTLIETVAYQWAKMVEHAADGLHSVPADQVLQIQSEDLWSKQQAVAKQLADFCQLPLREVEDATASTIAKSDRDGTHIPLSEEEWQLIWPIIKSSQQRLGYPPPCDNLYY